MSERDIFTAAREMTDRAERASFLNARCAGDTALRLRIERLLRADESPDSFLDVPAGELLDLHPGDTLPEAREQEVNCSPGSDGDDESFPFLEPPRRTDSLGRIGHYEVLEVLGRGGFGIVFRASDEALQRVVAVKVLSPLLAATAPARKRFLREARASAAVWHDNVVQVYAVEEKPLPYLVMEFIPGETLQQRLDRRGALEVHQVLSIGRQIAEGLAAAHVTGLIHRDVKPANVLLERGPGERVKLTDFGLARAADDSSITQSGLICGTPRYMSPEQAQGQSLDHRTDLFSLGSVLYTMCTGRPPFQAANVLAVLKRVAEETPRPISEINPEVPPWLCAIIARLQAKEPQQRFQSAREVADLLARGLTMLEQSKTLLQMPLPSGSPDNGPGDQALVAIPKIEAANRPGRRHGRRWAFALALSLVAAAATLVLLKPLSVRSKASPASAVSGETKGLPIVKTEEHKEVAQTIAPIASRIKMGQSIDLLPHVLLDRDVLDGEWSRDGKGYKTVQRGLNCKLRLPVEPGAAYVVRLAFASEGGNICLLLPIDGKGVEIAILGGRIALGFTARRYHEALYSDELLAPLNTGERHEALVEVARPGETQVRVTVEVDSRQALTWQGSHDELKVFDDLQMSQNCLVVNTFLHKGPSPWTRLFEAQLTTLKGQRQLLRPPAVSPAASN